MQSRTTTEWTGSMAERRMARFRLRECSIRKKPHGFFTSSRERWKVGANGASDRVSSDIQCAACGTERKIFRHGSITSQSILRVVIASNAVIPFSGFH
jgi:hypothetical protein